MKYRASLVCATAALACSSLCWTPTSYAGGPGIPGDLTYTSIASGLNRPVVVRHAGDGSNRLFIVEKPGRIRIYDQDTETLLTTPFLAIEGAVDSSGNEQGLLGLTFDPDYDTNGFFYVNYTRDPGPGLDRTIVERYTVSADPNIADDASAVTIIEIEQDFSNHNGGDIHFGPDGYLYIGMGDGGSGGDPNDRSQDRGELLGKMLRIDVSGSSRATRGMTCGLVGNYAIPADNPFVSDPATCDEIWALGVRNPWRFSFDRQTGDMFIADVGQITTEEVDLQPAGVGGMNWGWRCYEGPNIFNSMDCGTISEYDFPIFSFNHSGGNCSITGGYRYRGIIPGLQGYYALADYCSGRVWFGTDASGQWSFSEWTQDGVLQFGITAFGEDEAGELYFTHDNGSVYVFESATAAMIFADDFESGDTTAW